jgi:predicted NBD/HSP70 family sugar kinase
VCTVLGITTVVLGGGMGEHMPTEWLKRLIERTRTCAHPPPLADALAIVRTKLGPRAGLTGAALLAFELAETN